MLCNTRISHSFFKHLLSHRVVLCRNAVNTVEST
jgi:hypothetical protein